jgi:hypothetical protein
MAHRPSTVGIIPSASFVPSSIPCCGGGREGSAEEASDDKVGATSHGDTVLSAMISMVEEGQPVVTGEPRTELAVANRAIQADFEMGLMFGGGVVPKKWRTSFALNNLDSKDIR